MTKKNTTSGEFGVHAKILVGAVVAGLFVAGCSPLNQPKPSSSPSTRVETEESVEATDMPYLLPTTPSPMTTGDYNQDMLEIDASINAVSPAELDGNNLQ